jgi:hypothetical protein
VRHELWPPWLAVLHSIWHRTTAHTVDLLTYLRRPAIERTKLQGPVVPHRHVLHVLLLHELAKHPERQPTHLHPDSIGDDERSLSRLLQDMGWPRRRVRRILALRWRQTSLRGAQLPDIRLAPVPWVIRLGGGSTRAEDVAKGARVAMLAGAGTNRHLASIRQAMEEPPHPRVLVLRDHERHAVVEDGNHFVVATLLRYPDPSACPPIPCLVGRRLRGVWLRSALRRETVASAAEP